MMFRITCPETVLQINNFEGMVCINLMEEKEKIFVLLQRETMRNFLLFNSLIRLVKIMKLR